MKFTLFLVLLATIAQVDASPLKSSFLFGKHTKPDAAFASQADKLVPDNLMEKTESDLIEDSVAESLESVCNMGYENTCGAGSAGIKGWKCGNRCQRSSGSTLVDVHCNCCCQAPATKVKNYETVHAPGETVGPHLSGSGETVWSTLHNCISSAVAKGYKPGSTLRYVQKHDGKCYYYGPGSSSGAAGSDNWRIDHDSYETVHAPGETVGPHLSGSGETVWSTLHNCISSAVAKGYKPGCTLRYVQKHDGQCYYYGPGSSSGAAGSDNWRIDPTAETDELMLEMARP